MTSHRDTLLDALEDAIAYRREYEDGWCGDCNTENEDLNPDACTVCGNERAMHEPGDQVPLNHKFKRPARKLCLDHAQDEGLASSYTGLRDHIRHHRLAWWLVNLWELLAPDDMATQWYWSAGVHGCIYNFLHGNGWRVG